MEARPKSSSASTRRRPAKAAMAAASSPVMDPKSMFNSCGHDACPNNGCNVRYVGPVSHLRDHHALHAARGVTHVWTAAVVSGLAVVLTGVLAFSAAQARTQPSSDTLVLMQRLDRLEAMMRDVSQKCTLPTGSDDRQMMNGEEQTPPAPAFQKPVPAVNTNNQ